MQGIVHCLEVIWGQSWPQYYYSSTHDWFGLGVGWTCVQYLLYSLVLSVGDSGLQSVTH